jgi:hypothetical protein
MSLETLEDEAEYEYWREIIGADIAQEIENFVIPQAPTGNPMFEAMYNAQVTLKMRLVEIAKGNG